MNIDLGGNTLVDGYFAGLLLDSTGSPGTSGQILFSTGTGDFWDDAPVFSLPIIVTVPSTVIVKDGYGNTLIGTDGLGSADGDPYLQENISGNNNTIGFDSSGNPTIMVTSPNYLNVIGSYRGEINISGDSGAYLDLFSLDNSTYWTIFAPSVATSGMYSFALYDQSNSAPGGSAAPLLISNVGQSPTGDYAFSFMASPQVVINPVEFPPSALVTIWFDVNGNSLSVLGAYLDSTTSPGTNGQVLSSTGSATVWTGPSVQRFTPTSGNTINVTGFNSNPPVALINPSGTLATLIINADNGSYDGQTLTLSSTQILAAITFGTNFAAGITTVATANTGLRFVWDNTDSLWRQI